MGWAVPAAMGAKLALPNRPVVALLGDGDFMMIMQELSTMAQYEIPVIVIMANNAGWMAIKDLQIDAYGKEAAFGNDFMKEGKEYSPDFAKIAEAFHIDSYDIREIGQLEKAVKSAIAKNKPAFINVEVSRQYPLTGGKAFGWWDVPVPTYDEDRRKAYERARDQESL